MTWNVPLHMHTCALARMRARTHTQRKKSLGVVHMIISLSHGTFKISAHNDQECDTCLWSRIKAQLGWALIINVGFYLLKSEFLICPCPLFALDNLFSQICYKHIIFMSWNTATILDILSNWIRALTLISSTFQLAILLISWSQKEK